MLSPQLAQQLRFQPMTPAELPAVAAIEEASFPTPRSSEFYYRELTRNGLAHYWVIIPSQEAPALPALFAYAGYWLTGDEAHIVVIATHPAWRRHDIGTWLLLEMAGVVRMQGAQQLTLEVRHNNQAARTFYTELGFAEVGLRKRYYTDTGEDAHLLTLFGLDSGAVWHPLALQLAQLRQYYAADA